MVSSVDSDSVSECPMSTHSATGSTIKSTDSLLKFKSFMDFCVGFVQHVYFWRVCFGHFDSLLKEFRGIMGQLLENNTEVT